MGRVPIVTGFSAYLIELPSARNVWKFTTDVHILSPSFTCLLKSIPRGPDLLPDMLLISLWGSAPVDRHLTTFLPCRLSHMSSRATRKKCPSGKQSKSESIRFHTPGFTFLSPTLVTACKYIVSAALCFVYLFFRMWAPGGSAVWQGMLLFWRSYLNQTWMQGKPEYLLETTADAFPCESTKLCSVLL